MRRKRLWAEGLEGEAYGMPYSSRFAYRSCDLGGVSTWVDAQYPKGTLPDDSQHEEMKACGSPARVPEPSVPKAVPDIDDLWR